MYVYVEVHPHICFPLRHERYLGTWVEDVHCGPGMLVTSAGTYCEATFANGTIAVSAWSYDQCVMCA